jgi:hypothetical protein
MFAWPLFWHVSYYIFYLLKCLNLIPNETSTITQTSCLIPWYKIYFEKLAGIKLANKFCAVKEPGGLPLGHTSQLNFVHSHLIILSGPICCYPHISFSLFQLVSFHEVFWPKFCTHLYLGARGSVVVKALCYKPEGRGFDSRWFFFFFF